MKKTSIAVVMTVIMCLCFMLPFCPTFDLSQIKLSFASSSEFEEIDDTPKLIDGSLFNDPLGRLNFDGMVFPENIEELNYLEMLSRANYEAAINVRLWLEDLGFQICQDDYENCDDCQYVADNLHKILTKAVDLGIIENFLETQVEQQSNVSFNNANNSTDLTNSISRRWKWDAHKNIYNKAFNLLDSDGKHDAYAFFAPFEGVMEEHVIAPDRAENGQSSGSHFYAVKNSEQSTVGKYYKNKEPLPIYAPSARTRLENQYSAALNAYKNGDVNNAIKWLGWAIHHLEDIGNAAHSTGFSINEIMYLFGEDFHTEYEKRGDDICEGVTAPSALDFYSVFEENFEQPINDIAEYANSHFPSSYSISNPSLWDGDITLTLIRTQQYVAALLNQFYNDKLAIDGLVISTPRSEYAIEHNSIYTLKNLATSKYMDVKGWSSSDSTIIHQFGFHGDTNQQFRAIYVPADGSFKFEPLNAPGKRLTLVSAFGLAVTKVLVLKSSDDSGSNADIMQRFRITYLQDGKYRITRISPGDHLILRVSPSHSTKQGLFDINLNDNMYADRQIVDELGFNPESINHYWCFEKVVGLSNTLVNGVRQVTYNLKNSEVYKFTIDSSNAGVYKFISTNHSKNTFKLGYRTGTGNSNWYPVADSQLTITQTTCQVNLVNGRTYFLWVANLPQPKPIRYIRDWLNGSTANQGNHWVQIAAYESPDSDQPWSVGAGNWADINAYPRLDAVTSSRPLSTYGSMAEQGANRIINGDTNTNSYIQTAGNELDWVQIDLGQLRSVGQIWIWHYYGDGRTYFETRTQVSADGVNWIDFFNSNEQGTYKETSNSNRLPRRTVSMDYGRNTGHWMGQVYETVIQPGDYTIELWGASGGLREGGGIGGYTAMNFSVNVPTPIYIVMGGRPSGRTGGYNGGGTGGSNGTGGGGAGGGGGGATTFAIGQYGYIDYYVTNANGQQGLMAVAGGGGGDEGKGGTAEKAGHGGGHDSIQNNSQGTSGQNHGQANGKGANGTNGPILGSGGGGGGAGWRGGQGGASARPGAAGSGYLKGIVNDGIPRGIAAQQTWYTLDCRYGQTQWGEIHEIYVYKGLTTAFGYTGYGANPNANDYNSWYRISGYTRQPQFSNYPPLRSGTYL